ncbi:MAG: CHC2 zinc finger domain-containing protein [Prevotella sp.]|nr:CHC2 zinc finger domain-containing protein [Prevotella sp.]MCI2080900.1 CHC2 zinc finger domain-containing protein [Prevotella sp.]MCI2102794.1 CHC2 zinc finger domain-containing protein [Prevotella sp.]
MDRQQLQMLRQLPIEGVAERLGLRVTRHHCLCPFHDDTHPSLSFLVRKNTFKCFVCGKSGGTIDLVMGVLHVDFIDACRWLADAQNVVLTQRKPVEKPQTVKPFNAARYEQYFLQPCLNDAARWFLYHERHIDPRVVRWCKLTSWIDRQGINWLQVPYYDTTGKLIGMQNRNLNHRQHPESPRFRFPAGSVVSIYNQQVLPRLRPGEQLFITEGASDCWAMLSAGHKAIAIPSATLLHPDEVKMLQNLVQRLGTTFAMFPDQDQPGESLFMQLKALLPGIIHYQLPMGCKDFAEYYVRDIVGNSKTSIQNNDNTSKRKEAI